ncbi:MAG TPA: PDZ domain-containing protein [Candidatus Sulfotelmatobacter sp.]|nr:PDZ domain-containing protein [Candidatus Sulfotelmatobacter sp.]
MRKYVLTSILLVPLVLGVSYAAQTVSDPPGQPWVFSSEESGTSSYLGVDIADLTSERLSQLKLKEEKGVEVTMVDQDAPAGKAGIKEHDVILSMNGTAIESGAQLRRMIHETPAGRLVTLGLSRDGQPMTVKVQLADKHKEFAWATPRPDVHFQMPEIHVPDIDIPAINMVMTTTSARSGLMVENITPQLGEFFGVKNGNGVLVRSVEKGSRAEKAGFRAGDVIVKVNDHAVHDTSDFAHGMKSRSGNSVNVGLMRDKKELNLTLTLPERKESGELEMDESFDWVPTIRADSSLDELSEIQSEMARLRPQMRLAAENARKATQQLRQDFCREQKQIRQQTQKQREQARKNLEQLRHKLLQMRDDWL